MTSCTRHVLAKKQKSSKKIITSTAAVWKAAYLPWCVVMACGSADTSARRNVTCKLSSPAVLPTSNVLHIGRPVNDHNNDMRKAGRCIQVRTSLCHRGCATQLVLRFTNSISENAVLGSVDIFFYSLRSSSSSVGFWKKAIQGFIASSEIRKLSCEGREFLFSSRLNNSSSGTSR